MQERYAVYVAPEQGSELDLFGSGWLGRCARTGLKLRQPSLPGIAGRELLELTAAPRHYGFHATLVSPFALKKGCALRDILDRVRIVARGFAPFDLSRLVVKEVGNFLALVPGRQDEAAALAETCLRALQPLREPPSLAEMEKRRARGLTPTQERLLAGWGYPYVLQEYLFHFTLTGPVRDRACRRAQQRRIAEFAEPLRRKTHCVRSICLFCQESREAPFSLTHTLPLGDDRRRP
ncbi:DUF1045 domain-containing protein [Pseudodesulfovibrio sp. F-1]|uniref:DUF1045 domain-containing protein n=1 Tax=Pseudodesulfovibrio alkaliphilus TaxID=2661613 RepID=A0A7K1KSJ0_9BACT|nr:DUF1045 domain-containing protein [Pseudodesulfovibrio alkaliphilus]MUM78851.1 DUF1045 domain-containing protein [Pseudodesulfovibrio alkaliphilus]